MRTKEQKVLTRAGIGLVALFLWMIVVMGIEGIVRIAIQCVQQGTIASEQEMESIIDGIAQSGIGMNIAVITGTLAFYFWMRKYLPKGCREKKGKMDKKTFWTCLCVMMTLQLIFIVASTVAEWIANRMGYTVMGMVDDVSGISTTASMLLYVGVVGPIAEEVIFRGILQKSLAGLGERTAILMTALCFGCYHGNFLQGFFAVFVGILFGYVAQRYSIGWSIFFHVLNNLGVSELLQRALSGLPQRQQDKIMHGILIFFALETFLIFWKKRGQIREGLKRSQKEVSVWSLFRNIGMILFWAAGCFMAFDGISKL